MKTRISVQERLKDLRVITKQGVITNSTLLIIY